MMSGKDGHYPNNLVNGARILDFFGDVGTELMVRAAGDISLFVGYSEIKFTAPVHVGDFMEYYGWIEKVGTSSFTCQFEAYKVITMPDDFKIKNNYMSGVMGEPNLIEAADSAAVVLDPPVLCATATGTLVVGKKLQRGAQDPAFER